MNMLQATSTRVLLVDDDEDDYTLVRDLLSDFRASGGTLHWVSDYAAAMEAIHAGQFDVCLLDYWLGSQSGLEFLSEVTHSGCRTPVIFLTGKGDYELDLAAMRTGAADYLTKDQLSTALLERSIRYTLERRQKNDELFKANRIIRALSECNAAMLRIKDETELLREICRIVVEVGGYRMAWVGYAEQNADQTVTPVAKYGHDEGYLDSIRVTWQEEESGRCPAETSIRTGFPSLIRDVGTDERFLPWREEALKRGYASVIGLPLPMEGRVLGALTIYASEQDAFNPEEVELLVKLSGNLSYGIGALRWHRAHWKAEESLKKAYFDLERKVQERTAELVQVNAELRKEVEERRQAEDALRVSLRFLEIVYKHSETAQLLKEYVSEIKSFTGCDAVGIRVLDENWNIPYMAYEGFSQEFYELESPLSLKSDECMCINVISGNVDPRLPFYAEGGAFCVNATSRFLATVSEEEKGHSRNRCNAEGYETVALFPIRSGDRILGLIHVADHRENMVPPNVVKILEKAALQLGTAFQKARAESELRKSEEHYRSLFDNMLNGFAYCRMLFDQDQPRDFIYLNVNAAFETLTGLKNVIGKKVSEVIPGIRESDPEILRIYGKVALTGIPERFETYVESLGMWFSVSAYSPQKEYFVAVFEVITERKKAEEEIRRLNSLYDVLSQVGQAIVRIQSREELLSTVCRLVVERSAIDLAWIGWFDPETSRIKPSAYFGNRAEMLTEAHFYADDRLEEQGNPGKAVREGKPFVCNKCGSKPCLYPSEESPAGFGFGSCGSFPLRFRGRVCGALTLCVAEQEFFQEREIELLSEVAEDVSFALDKIEGDYQRERLTQEFEQQSTFLHSLMDAMPNPVFYKDAKLRYLGCNAAFEHVTGKQSIDIAGKTTDFCWPQSLAEYSDQMDRQLLASAVGQTAFYNWTYKTPDGTPRNFLVHKAVFRNKDGNPQGIIGAMVDVTARRQAEEARQLSEERFRLAMQGANDGLWDRDLKTDDVYYSPRWKSMLGYAEDELEGTLDIWKRLVHPDDLESAQARVRDLLEGRTEKFEAEFRMLHKDGRYIDILSRAFLFKRSEDDAGRMIGTHVDITERKAAEAALRASEAKFRSYIEHAPLAVFVTDREGHLLDFNSSGERLLGYDTATLKGMSILDLHPEENREKVLRNFQTLLAKGHFQGEFQMKRRDGGLIWISLQAVMITDQLALGYCRDISERKRAEEQRTRVEAQLRQAQKMEALGTLAGGIAHDFNNILGIIMGYAEMAKFESAEGGTLLSNLEEVINATNRAKALVKQILAFSRRSEQEKIPLHLGMIVKEAMRILRPSFPSTIEINTNVLSKTTILADPTQMHQVLMNLCTNAAHSMQNEFGILEVGLTDIVLRNKSAASRENLKPGRYVALTVKDSGHGIDPAIIDSIFDPFFTTKQMGEGTGLGLSVVHGIVESHGGAIKVKSTPGKGTMFTVLIPALETDNEPGPVEIAVAFPRGSERVLVVDDEPMLAKMVKRMLEKQGYDVVSHTSGTEALELFRHHLAERPFDLVITDMTMPHLTGEDFARALFALQPAVPVILMTGYSNKIDADRARELGIQGFLMKPVAIEELAKTVRTVLDNRRARSEKHPDEV